MLGYNQSRAQILCILCGCIVGSVVAMGFTRGRGNTQRSVLLWMFLGTVVGGFAAALMWRGRFYTGHGRGRRDSGFERFSVAIRKATEVTPGERIVMLLSRLSESGVEITVSETYYCPIKKQIMRIPVLAPDGNSYERSALQEWYDRCGGQAFCPLDPSVPLPSPKDLMTNERLQEFIISDLVALIASQQQTRGVRA